MQKGTENLNPTSKLEYVLKYVRLFWSVIALRPPVAWDPTSGKRSWGRWKQQTVERLTEDELVQFFARYPTANVGLVCGRISNVVAVDFDSPDALAWGNKNLPKTPLVSITRKGEHRFYAHPGVEVRPGAKLRAMALDLRADDSFVVIPPSKHYSGHVYRWVEEPTAEMLQALPVFDPAWLADERTRRRSSTIESGSADPVTRSAAYIAKIPGAVAGQGGHNATFRVACLLVQRFGLSVEEAYPLMLVWNATCQPPWRPADIRRKLDEAVRVMGTHRGETQRVVGESK